MEPSDLTREIVDWTESGEDPELPLPHSSVLLVWSGRDLRLIVHDFSRCGDPGCLAFRRSFSEEDLENFLEDRAVLVRREGEKCLTEILEIGSRHGGPPPPMAFVLALSDPRDPRAGVKERWMFLPRKDEERRAETWEKVRV